MRAPSGIDRSRPPPRLEVAEPTALQPGGDEEVAMAAEPTGRDVEVAAGGEVVALAHVQAIEGRGVVRAALHAQSGHLPSGTRSRLVDAVLDLPETRESSRLEATVPLGDAESLDRLRERCDEVQTRPAGASCLVDAALPGDAAGSRERRAG
jgi:hypothetical protein